MAVDMVQIFRFGITGLVVTVLHTLVATIAIKFVMLSPPLANGIAFLVATLCSYQMNTRWSFAAVSDRKNFYRFWCVSGVGLVLAMLISGAADHWGQSYLVGIGLVVCVVPVVSYFLHNAWTYR